MCCTVKEFCCGCTLRHGAITAAILNGICALILFATGAQFLFTAGQLDNHTNSFPNEGSQKQAVNIMKIVGGVLFAMGIISAIIFACLIVGIVKNLSGFVMPWLVGCMINIVLSCIYVLVLLIFGNFISLFSLPVAAFYIYLWIVVLNYYRELQSGPPPYTHEAKA